MMTLKNSAVMLKDEIGINLNDQMNPEEDVTAKMNINNFLVLVKPLPNLKCSTQVNMYTVEEMLLPRSS